MHPSNPGRLLVAVVTIASKKTITQYHPVRFVSRSVVVIAPE
jgi:hypothetical protein